MYFGKAQSDEIGTLCMDKVHTFVKYIKNNGINGQWEDVWLQYHAHQDGFMQKGIRIKGREAEVAKIVINHIRNIVQHILVYTTSNRPSFLTRATNGDASSLMQASLADSLVNYYLREKSIESVLTKAAEAGLVLGSGYAYIGWDKFLGKSLNVVPRGHIIENTPQERQMEDYHQYEGDIEAFNPSIYDVFYDPTKRSFKELEWVIVRRFKNKYDLAERYPNAADALEAQAPLTTQNNAKTVMNSSQFIVTGNENTDDIEYFEFFHKKSILLPKGRKVVMMSDGTVLSDGPFEDPCFPVFRISPSTYIDSSLGYAPTFDMQGLQEAHNLTYGMILTNIMLHGLQHIQVPSGTDIDIDDILGGSTVFRVDPNQKSEVKGVNLLNIPEQLFNNLGVIEKSLETTSGVNSVARGNIEASQRSGSALALVQSMAIQYNSGFQNEYAMCLEDVGTQIIRLIKQNAQNERIIEITGISDRAYLKSFDPQNDLQHVDKVVVDIGNPLFKTIEGRQQIADKLLAEGHIMADMYIMFMRTGQLKPLFKAKEAMLSLITAENDMMINGQFDNVEVTPYDNPVLHMQEHAALLANPEVRSNPQLSAQIHAHIEEHLVQWKQLSITAPDFLMALGFQPLAPTFGSNVPMAENPGSAPQAPTLNMNGAEPVNPMDQSRLPTNPLTKKQVPKPSKGPGQ